MATALTTTIQNGHLYVQVPYCPDFPPRARQLGGRWLPQRRAWEFDVRDRDAVESALADVFGYGDQVVTMVVNLDAIPALHSTLAPAGELWLAGRLLVKRANRDFPPRLGDGVVVRRGGFAARGGSAKHPAIAPNPGTILAVRDVPRSLAEREAARNPGVTIETEEV